MSNSTYLIIHKDHALTIHGVNSGAEMATLSLARFLRKAGHRVIVAAQLVEEEQEDQGVSYWDLQDDFNVTAILERARALGSYHLISGGRAQAILESRNEPACRSRILISHDRSGNDTGIQPAVLTRVADAVICVSRAQRDVFVNAGANPEKVHVVHNGVDLNIFAAGDSTMRDYQRLVFAGALVPDKGIQLLIPAFAALRTKYPELKLDVYGSSTLWGREAMFNPQDIARQVPGITFHGNVAQAEIAAAYRTAGIAVVPSIWFDPFPLSSIEAQVCGCPVVTCDVGGLKEGIKDGETGIVIADITQDSLTHTLDTLLQDPVRLQAMSKRSLETARSYFNWERVVGDIEQIVATLAGTNDTVSADTTAIAPRPSMTEKRIGFMTTWNQECGLATYARFLIDEFEPETFVVLAENNTEITAIDEPFVRRCWSRAEANYDSLREIIQQEDLGLLHINAHNHEFFSFPEFQTFLADIRGTGVQVFLSLHSAFCRHDSLRTLVRNVDLTLTHTPEVRLEVIANGACPNAVAVLNHGVTVQADLSETTRQALRQKLSMPTSEKIIVAFGFVQPHKGMDAVLAAVLALRQQGIAAQGYIAGKPNPKDPNSQAYQKQLQQLASNAGIADAIHFLDTFLPQESVVEYLQAADLVFMNYQSQHYEASGACSLAIGAGALVATSVAPAFATFGDAVWHMTAGYQADSSALLLLTNEVLAQTIRENAVRYCDQYSWAATKDALLALYQDYGVIPTRQSSEVLTGSLNNSSQEVVQDIASLNSAVDEEQRGLVASCSLNDLRVLIQNRTNALTQPGGDTIVMRRVIEQLTEVGVQVVLDLEGQEDPAEFDIVHIFNFATPAVTEAYARRAKEAGTPFVITTLCEDAPAYRNQAMRMAQHLTVYAKTGQQRDWYEKFMPDLMALPDADRFDNSWVVSNAACLLTNGLEESRVIKRDYGEDAPVVEVPLGFDYVTNVDPELFVREYGVRDFVLCVGRLEFRKNQLMLLKALEDSDVPLVLAAGGFSYDQEYANAVKEFSRAGRTIVTDRLSPQMLASAYAAAKVHALPSWYELPGLVSLEAAYHGCGIVASLFGTSHDYLGELAHYCDPASEDSVRRAVEAALAEPKTDALQAHVKQFTWAAMGARTLEIYSKITQKKVEQEQEAITVETKTPESQGQAVEEVFPTTLDSGGYDLAGGTTEFQELLERGELAAKNKDYNIAHDLLFRAEQLCPQSVRVLRARGAVFLAENQTLSARRYFERAFEFDAQDPKTLSGLGMCYMNTQETEKAYECFVHALSTTPDALVAILQLLECSYTLNKFDDLVRSLRGYLELHPGDDEMRYCLAGALYKQGMYREANAMTEIVLQGVPEHTGAKQLTELLADKLVTPDEATTISTVNSIEAQVETTVCATAATAPIDMEVESEIARLEELKRKKEVEQVAAGCDSLLAMGTLSSEQTDRVECLGAEILVLKSKTADAEAIFETVLQRSPSCARALVGKGALAAAQGRWDEAERLFQQAMSIQPKYDVALAGLGLCAASRQNSHVAWTYYMQALESNPENMRALLGVLEIGYPLQRFAEIEKVLQKYIDLHPGDTELLYSLAGCYYVQGKVSEAAAEVNRLTLLVPEHEGARELSAMIAQKTGAATGSSSL